MKLHRILTLPFAMAADVLTLCNIGSPEGSFTQQVFDAEERERKAERELAALKKIMGALGDAMGRRGP
jgi:hypothetical protein